MKKVKDFLKVFGPGLITGASDDDPSGIATYSQAGAKFGLATLWTAIITFPLMAAIQEVCARIGLVTKQGLAGVIKKHYPRWILIVLVVFSVPAIIMNIGADIAGMGAVSNLLVPDIPADMFSFFFAFLLIITLILFPYKKIAMVMKWLCVSLLLYLVIPFLIESNWLEILKNAVIPQIKFNKDFLLILIGILGTTISPYLFFWQASVEVEEKGSKKVVVDKKLIHEMHQDVDIGMLFSNLVMFFIILTTGSVLFKNGITEINTVEEAARALAPLAGDMAYLLFAIGVIGTGFLAIPVLAGSLSYIITEAFGWREGLNKKFHQARAFYLIIIVSVVIGLGLNFIGISPVKALIYSAILYGITSPVLIAIILHVANNKKIMGQYKSGYVSNTLGIIALIFMTAAVVALFIL